MNNTGAYSSDLLKLDLLTPICACPVTGEYRLGVSVRSPVVTNVISDSL